MKRFLLSSIMILFIFNCFLFAQEFDWQPQPEKAAFMIIFAHPDDEGIWFGGAIPYYAVVKNLPTVAICMTTTSWLPERKSEMECAIWKYGMKNPPIFADFPDCCYQTNIVENWKEWGGQEKVVGYLTQQIRKYRPDVILTHGFNGEYGHPNHMVTAYATVEAVFAAMDSTAFPEQLKSLSVWQVPKLYIHNFPNYGNITTHSWRMKCKELGDRSPKEVANEALKCHVSQGENKVRDPQYSENFGLYFTSVGPDSIAKDDFFEHIDISKYK